MRPQAAMDAGTVETDKPAVRDCAPGWIFNLTVEANFVFGQVTKSTKYRLRIVNGSYAVTGHSKIDKTTLHRVGRGCRSGKDKPEPARRQSSSSYTFTPVKSLLVMEYE